MQNTGSQETSKSDVRRLALHVLFLAGGDGLAAHLAAHWTKFLANGCLEVKAAAPGETDLTAALNCAPADLVVVIHTPGDPGPLVAHNCGGRIDWDLEVDVTGSPVELTSQVRRHVMRLLGDLGMPQAHSDFTATHSSCPPTVLELPNRLDARARLLAA
jgi:hypothetical protein